MFFLYKYKVQELGCPYSSLEDSTPKTCKKSSPLSTCKIIDCVSNFQTSCRLITNHTYIINGNGHVIVARQQCIKYLYSFLTHTAQLFDVAHGHG